jgi:inosine-uridine nucleoside N-ribohydrolase
MSLNILEILDKKNYLLFNSRKLIAFLILAAFLNLTCESITKSKHMKIIIDTDMAFDDCIAILYLLNHPEAKVLGITVAGTGEAHSIPGVENALQLLRIADKENDGIVVTGGDNEPMDGYHVFPTAWRRDVDSFFYHDKQPTTTAADPRFAVDYLIEKLSDSKEMITLLVLGPLTNIAEAFEKNPAIKANVEKIVIMGGAVNVPGNLIIPGHSDHLKNNYAEWNIYCDPLAAQIVVRSGLPVYLISLDGTNQIPVTPAFVERMRKQSSSKIAQFILAGMDVKKWAIDAGHYYFWDVLAAAAAVQDDLVEYEQKSLDVIVKYIEKKPDYLPDFPATRKNGQHRRPLDEYESGWTKEVKSGWPVFVPKMVDGQAFEDRFIKVVTGNY